MDVRSWGLAILLSAAAYAQRGTGELRLRVVDAAGLPVQASGLLSSRVQQVSLKFTTDENGRYQFKALPFGPYHVSLEHAGFTPVSTLLTIDSEAPRAYRMELGVLPVETLVTVREDATLLNPDQTGNSQHLGKETLDSRRASAPGRALLEMVNTQPGWLLEANGVLHPRGSEYEVQYVIDGIPFLDNRSPAFAQSMGVEEFQSMRVMTGGYPAEYGRKLGGVVEVNTDRNEEHGFHGAATASGGSFGSGTGYFSGQFRSGRQTFGGSAEGFRTDRYLDGPVEQNFSNHASGGGMSARYERDWSDRSRTRLYAHSRKSGFLVPNQILQQDAGQRQDRRTGETMGYWSQQFIFTPHTIGTGRLMVRDTSAELWSNRLSIPIAPFQNRGFRETYATGTVSTHRGRHEFKMGGEAAFSSVREDFGFRITAYRMNGERIFDRDVPQNFHFLDRAQGREQAAFAQDLIRLGRLTLSAGLRYDHYKLIADEHAVSPRFAAAFHVPKHGLVLRASYDRVFQTPATENLLLASSDLVPRLGGEGLFLPLKPSRANFLEAGFSKSVGGKLRVDGAWFRRDIRNFADDDVLFNTGVSFPITFDRGLISGYEAKLEMPRWGPFSGFASYGNLIGHGYLPVAGGLFLGDEAADLLQRHGRFPITQDQRNTVRARWRTGLGERVWAAAGYRYNSGLPVEFEDDGIPERDDLVEQYGAAVVERVDFARGRVRPSLAVDLSAAVSVLQRERQRASLQFDLLNLTDRLNVINFAGLFSGTAIEPRRTLYMRLQFQF